MNVITLKSYAESRQISYEAVRQQVVRYQKELENHIIKDGRQQFLDEEAVAFLDDKRNKNPVVIIQEDLRSELEETKAALERLKFEYAKNEGKIELLNQQLREKEDKSLILLQAESQIEDLTAVADELEARAQAAEEASKSLIQEADQAKEKAEQATLEADRAKLEAEAYKKYAEDLEAYLKLPFLKRLLVKKPTFDSITEIERKEE